MKSKSLSEIINRIDDLFQIHLSLRGIVQYLGPQYIDRDRISWKSKVPANSFDINFTFVKKINQETISDVNKLSDYLNQNFILRLHSILEYEGFLGKNIKIDKNLEGHIFLELIHFLRPHFAHKTGKHNPENKKSAQLRERLFNEFNIDYNESLPNQFPLDKNRVILPIVNGTKKYIELYWNKHRTSKE